MPPLVSIIIPTLNRRGLLMHTLDSLCDQTYPHWEAVVVDDGSTDGTEAMMERFCRWEPRIRYRRRQGNVAGANVCRNQGVEASHGEFIIFLDSDDLLAPHCLEGRVKVMEENPELDFAVFMGELFADTPGDLGLLHNVLDAQDDLDRFLRWDNPWSLTGPIWRRVSFQAVGCFDEALPRWQDWDLHVRTLIRGLRYANIQATDYFVRYGQRPRGSIGQRPFGAIQADAAATAFERAAGMLSAVGALTPERRQALVKLFWFCCRSAVADHSTATARRIWDMAVQSCGVSKHVAREGRLILALSDSAVLPPRLWAAVQYVWKSRRDLAITQSRTFMCTRCPVAGTD